MFEKNQSVINGQRTRNDSNFRTSKTTPFIRGGLQFCSSFLDSKIPLQVLLTWDKSRGRLKLGNKESGIFSVTMCLTFSIFLIWTHHHLFILSLNLLSRLCNITCIKNIFLFYRPLLPSSLAQLVECSPMVRETWVRYQVVSYQGL